MATTVNLSMFGTLLCCLLATSLALPNKAVPEVGLRGLDASRLPLNTYSMPGNNVTFTCSSSVGSNARIQWHDFSKLEWGDLISDGSSILPGHPNAARFSINATSPRQFDLTIHNVELGDGGKYQCSDSNAPSTEKQRHSAYLTIIEDDQACITTVPPTGVAVEDVYYTYECRMKYGGPVSPNMRWSGPLPFGQAQSDNGQEVWSGLSFYADRLMATQHWTSLANFTESALPPPPDTAINVPDYSHSFDTPRLQVNWPPQDINVEGVKPLNEYLVGDLLECVADAFPTGTFTWHNLRTNERIDGSLLTIPPEWLGTNNPMRCEVYNSINGFRYNREHPVTVNVPIPLTTPTTTPPTTTTPPPAVAPCLNLTGRWESAKPLAAYMCLEVSDFGNIHGVIRNATDTYWIDLVGSTNLPTFDHASFTGIWALNRAVSTFIGECSRCFGEENLLVSAISRTKGGPPCGQPGDIFYSQEYEFKRNPTVSCPPITAPTFGG
jgi:hypothetical protein